MYQIFVLEYRPPHSQIESKLVVNKRKFFFASISGWVCEWLLPSVPSNHYVSCHTHTHLYRSKATSNNIWFRFRVFYFFPFVCSHKLQINFSRLTISFIDCSTFVVISQREDCSNEACLLSFFLSALVYRNGNAVHYVLSYYAIETGHKSMLKFGNISVKFNHLNTF